MTRRVVVLRGGPSGEREVSLVSGASVLAALRAQGAAVVDAVLEPDGSMSFDGDAAVPLAQAMPRLAELGAVVFLALHGTFGEDGTVQGLLESFGVPYTGSGVTASALAMDKLLSRRVAQSLGLRVARAVEIGPGADDAATARVRAERLAYPVFVKPARSGSSVGVTRVESPQGLPAALAAATAEGGSGGRAVLEEGIEGVEVSCPVLGAAGAARALPVVEIVPRGHSFFDYVAKYTPGQSEEICPARLAPDVTARLQDAALRIHDAFGCHAVSRSDFILPADGEPVFLEVNTLPGMTPMSLVPLAAAAVGIDFGTLCAMLVEGADPRRRAFS